MSLPRSTVRWRWAWRSRAQAGDRGDDTVGLAYVNDVLSRAAARGILNCGGHIGFLGVRSGTAKPCEHVLRTCESDERPELERGAGQDGEFQAQKSKGAPPVTWVW